MYLHSGARLLCSSDQPGPISQNPVVYVKSIYFHVHWSLGQLWIRWSRLGSTGSSASSSELVGLGSRLWVELRSAPHVVQRPGSRSSYPGNTCHSQPLEYQRQAPLCKHRSFLCSHMSTNIPWCSKSWQLHYLNFETTFSQTMLLRTVLCHSVSLIQDTWETDLAFTAREEFVFWRRTSLLFPFQ